MLHENEIMERIDTLTAEMRAINGNPGQDLFSHMADLRKALDNYKEIKTIYWILDEPLPKNITLTMV